MREQDMDIGPEEPVIEPDLPIVDAHHHLWLLSDAVIERMAASENLWARMLAPAFRCKKRYLLDEFLTDASSGHNIRATVFVDAHAMYRSSGTEAMKSVGEVEFVNGVAAMSASGLFGNTRVCAGIVGGVDLLMGEAVEDVLAAHIQAGGGRYRGVRTSVVHDDDPNVIKARGRPHLLLDGEFRRGFARLSRFGLSFDAWVLEPQLPDVVDLARAFPETPIILNHTGTPVGIGRYAGQRETRFPLWRRSILQLSQLANVTVKLGGLGTPFPGFSSFDILSGRTSAQLAAEWRPYIETCIELFGPDRCMFESNFPVDFSVANYAVLWNAFKRIVQGASREEKAQLFAGTASRVYALVPSDG